MLQATMKAKYGPAGRPQIMLGMQIRSPSTQWVGAEGAFDCPQACRGTAHQPVVAAANPDNRPSAAAVRSSCSQGACPQDGEYLTVEG